MQKRIEIEESLGLDSIDGSLQNFSSLSRASSVEEIIMQAVYTARNQAGTSCIYGIINLIFIIQNLPVYIY